ncbi:hypothetical protein V1264_016812 [Littorina saxatilis]|uniref:Uncharacterized protein n=1 Tax=Littorina saxatilis TaxID=31220 RepID=A0AAN9BHT6_9CAEN
MVWLLKDVVWRGAVFAVVVVVLGFVTSVAGAQNGMSSRLFRGTEHFQELQCSARTLPAHSDVLHMVMYEPYPKRVLLRANLKNKVCWTEEHFASCEISGSETNEIKLKMLIPNVAEGMTRAFGCNVTALVSDTVVKTYSWRHHVRHLRLTSRSFQGFHNLHEMQCSGENLSQDSDLMTMVLYEVKSSKVLAAANLRKQECSTSSSYIACHLDATDTRKSKLKALVDDLAEGQSRVYGCNVSAFMDGTRVKLFTWFITVRHISK